MELKKWKRKFADDIAKSLHLDSYKCLVLGHSFSSTWKHLINDDKYQSPFLSFSDHSKSALYLATFQTEQDKELDKIPVTAQWHLDLLGYKGEELFLILQSESIFFQLSPVNLEGSANKFKICNLRYPKKTNFSFDITSGLGWRRIIAVKSKFLPCEPSDRDVNSGCTIDDLNIFASRLLETKNNSIAVDKYEFELVN